VVQSALRHKPLTSHFGRRQAGSGRRAATLPAFGIRFRITGWPGATELDDLEITLEDSLLTIQGERHLTNDAPEQQHHQIERRYGAFRRSITLPAHVMADAVEASIEDGVLETLAPKGK
jgi:Hsp20/alpha crystallin family